MARPPQPTPTTSSFQISDELWEVLVPFASPASEHPSFGRRPAAGPRPDLRQRHLLRAAHRLPVESLSPVPSSLSEPPGLLGIGS